ncbi:MAG: MlaD family protein [Kiritimatiellae bacterium]|nr:MlaD family protein [Kiritimatiellia bacterium]
MSKKINPAAVGGFVAGAIAILIGALIVFGGGSMFRQTKKWVLFFEGSVKGLSQGSPVVFKGVRIGSVSSIRVHIDKDNNIHTPVVIEIDPSQYEKDDKKMTAEESLATTRVMIERGLRAQLQLQSLITGQLLIQLDFFPDRPPRLVAPEYCALPEMPTIPSASQEISKTLESLPLEEIAKSIHNITIGLDKFINSPELGNTLSELNATLKKTHAVLAKIDAHVDPIGNEAHKVLVSASALIEHNDAKISSLLEDLGKTSAVTREEIQNFATRLERVSAKADEQFTGFFNAISTISGYAEKMASDQTGFRHDLHQTLAELEATLRAIRLLAEYMEQHPEALIQGKAQ